ncbi:MAG: amidohydrolase [Bacteroidota bacterium]|nr:amidohydrolase [Bacteroidota bacterium]
MNQKLVKIRHQLHQNPELANKEIKTAERVSAFMSKLKPDELIDVSKTGKLFVFDSKREGKTSVFRADMDALPISEESNLEYISLNNGIAHSCGHDGHMTIVLGLAEKIANNRPKTGKVVLLFQPAEESEQGARDVVNSTEFKTLNPDYIFGLHNIPKAPMHQIIVKKGSFAAASKGMTIKLFGKSSHAAEPEKGISPARAISKIIAELDELRDNKALFSGLVLLTIINIKLGEIAFGTSPGYAEIRITLRTFENDDMQLLTEKTESIIKGIARGEQLKPEIAYSEVFPATVNNENCCSFIKKSAVLNKCDIKEIETPFKWSEDFGYYTEKYNACFFGLGSGIYQPALHNPDYNFPDEIIETGVDMFYEIYKLINSENQKNATN